METCTYKNIGIEMRVSGYWRVFLPGNHSYAYEGTGVESFLKEMERLFKDQMKDTKDKSKDDE